MDSQSDCFHGKLDRRTAEDRLNAKGKVGAFLLRESDRKTDAYVLSYYGRTGINHFRITHVYGSYFIGGRQFDSLLDLIEYYTSTCDLITDERLLFPVAPPEPVSAKERLFISILPYSKLAQSDELSFQKGDLFILQNDLADGWLWCRDVKTGESGMVFSHLVEEISEDIDPNEVFPWFHARLSKADAVTKLAQAGPGSFLVRPSDNSPGNYTLFYHVGTTVQRFLIVRNADGRYTMGGKCFESLGQIIDLYQREQIIEGHILQYPVTTTMSRANQLSESTLSTSMRALQIRESPQDVYNTVKMSREAAKLKQINEVKGWLSLKKGDLHKKWKNYYFVLNSRDRHIYYYEKPQQTKPKGLIDLSYSFAYNVHESLFDNTQCLLLVEKCLPCFANHFYLRCDENFGDYNRWASSIRRFTSSNQSTKGNVDALIDINLSRRSDPLQTSGRDEFEERKTVQLCFMEAHSIKASQPYFLIAFNHDIKVAKTPVKTSPSAVFNEDGYFVFENIPSEVKSISVFIQQGNKKSKANSELAQISVDLRCFRSEKEHLDSWFEFRTTQSSDVLGYLRVKLKQSCDIIMSLTEYAALEDLVCDPNAEVITLLDQICHRDHLVLARALSNLFRYKKTSLSVLRSLIERESRIETETTSFFRTSSLVTAILESYMRSMSGQALVKCLQGPVKRLLDDKISCELNPAKIESHNVSQKACENLQNLLDLLDELVSNIYESISLYPPQVRYLFACLQRTVKRRWPNEPLVRTRAVSGFLFLRIICPTILNPKQFSLVTETPSENAIRNLTLIAKCLQNLANLVETSRSNNSLAQSILSTLDDYATYPLNRTQQINHTDCSAQTNSILAFILSPQIESWMEVVNPFILKNKIGMIKFIDELCNVDFTDSFLLDDKSSSVDGNNNDQDSSCYGSDSLNPAYDLAVINNVCENYHHELEQLSNSSNAARKLVTILTILSQHRQYYNNLRKNARQSINTTLV